MKAITFNVKNQLHRITSIIEDILALSAMMRGSYGDIYQRCGKPTCWCANTKEKGHLCTRLMWTDVNGVKTRSVREDDKQSVKNAVEQYHQYKKLRIMLKTEEKKLEELLTEFERNTTKTNKTKMGYL